MPPTEPRKVRKNLRLSQAKLRRAQRILGTATETETVERALDLVASAGDGITARRGDSSIRTPSVTPGLVRLSTIIAFAAAGCARATIEPRELRSDAAEIVRTAVANVVAARVRSPGDSADAVIVDARISTQNVAAALGMSFDARTVSSAVPHDPRFRLGQVRSALVCRSPQRDRCVLPNETRVVAVYQVERSRARDTLFVWVNLMEPGGVDWFESTNETVFVRASDGRWTFRAVRGETALQWRRAGRTP